MMIDSFAMLHFTLTISIAIAFAPPGVPPGASLVRFLNHASYYTPLDSGVNAEKCQTFGPNPGAFGQFVYLCIILCIFSSFMHSHLPCPAQQKERLPCPVLRSAGGVAALFIHS
jgi:hypothetical protein